MKKIIKELSGNVLLINTDENISNLIVKNNKVIAITELSDQTKKGTTKKGKNKNINIKKLKKIYAKKSIDYLICDYEKTSKYINFLIRSCPYLIKEKVYFYNMDLYYQQKMIRKFKRYKVIPTIINQDDFRVVSANLSNTKYNFLKNIIYTVFDSIDTIIELIGDILMN